MIEGHPKSWEGKEFVSTLTGDRHKVLKVVKNRSRYSVKLDSDNDWLRCLGYDSRVFSKQWEPVPIEPLKYHCPTCGYTHEDALIHGDHHLCKTPMPTKS